LAGVTTVLALLAYLLGLYLSRIDRRGEAALDALRERLASATGAEILSEHRTYHQWGLKDVPEGTLAIFYRTQDGWLLVPLLEDLSWIEVPAAGVRLAALEDQGRGRGVRLRLELESVSGQDLRLDLNSTRVERSRQTRENVLDLIALRDAMKQSQAS
jgi:hypothetical protein